MADGTRPPKRTKNVRWTGSHAAGPDSSDTDNRTTDNDRQDRNPDRYNSDRYSDRSTDRYADRDRQSDRYNNSNSEQPQPHSSLPSKVYVHSDSEDSDSDSDSGSDDVAQTTRKNTWFNRMRTGDNTTDDDDDDGTTDGTTTDGDDDDTLAISVPPRIRISGLQSANPFANLMDVGTRTSGGLAPGTDSDYRNRRNRLSNSQSRSQPTSPSLTPLDSQNSAGIPLQDLPVQTPPEFEGLDASTQAEVFRKKVEHEQQKRQKAISRILAKQNAAKNTGDKHESTHERTNERRNSNSSDKRHSAGSNSSSASARTGNTTQSVKIGSVNGQQNESPHNDNASTTSSQRRPILRTRLGSLEEDSESDEEKKRLKDLEESNKQQAVEHARALVNQHVQSSEPPEHAGYVPNNDLAMNIGLDDDNLSAIESDGDQSSHKENEKEEAESDDSSSDDDLSVQRREANMRGDPDYVPPPKQVKEGVLGSLLRLYAGQEDDKPSPGNSTATSPTDSPFSSPPQTPSESDASNYLNVNDKKKPAYLRTYSSEDALGRESKGRPKWYQRSSSSYVPSLHKIATSGINAAEHANSHIRNPLRRTGTGGKIHTMTDLAQDAAALGHKGMENVNALRDKEARRRKKKIDQQRREKEKALKKARMAEQARITVHIADVLQRQRFLLRLGRALMLFGAPSHRLEEYLKITSRVLEIDAQVLYIPGCMLISFGDATTHTSETKLLRVTQGLNLGKLHATHLLYKEVVHDLMGLEEASSHIDHLLTSKDMYPWWLVVIFYGIACLSFGMYSYGGYWNDLPILFLVGGAVGFLQFWVQPRSDLYSNVFEVSSSIIVSFVGRAIGSIGHGDDRVFCFAAIVQGSLSLILPGYIILVGALELQTKNLVAGSVRMFYANIYSLFLSFGITLGSAIYGWCDSTASGETTCHRTIDAKWRILFVPAATAFIAAVNQASPRQLPVMVVVGCSGYCVLYFVQLKVPSASAFTSAIGAFTIGILGNLYSRVGHGLAFAAMLPGIFCLVPSGVAAQGSLVAGVAYADAIVQSTDGNATSTSMAEQASNDITQLGSTMTQVAVGIVVGLFAATLFVYPLGFKKKRSGLFTF